MPIQKSNSTETRDSIKFGIDLGRQLDGVTDPGETTDHASTNTGEREEQRKLVAAYVSPFETREAIDKCESKRAAEAMKPHLRAITDFAFRRSGRRPFWRR